MMNYTAKDFSRRKSEGGKSTQWKPEVVYSDVKIKNCRD